MIGGAVYEVTDALVEWTSQTFLQVQQSTFQYFRELFDLVKIVDAVEGGRMPKFAALSAIRNHNEENKTDFTYESIRDRDSSFIFSDYGEWVVFTDNPDDIICGKHDIAEEALTLASDSVDWIIVWDIQENVMVVYRSPYVADRMKSSLIDFPDYEIRYTDGERRGDIRSYVLPPEIEASLHEMEKGELTRHYMHQRS